jgi:hypothetical protein
MESTVAKKVYVKMANMHDIEPILGKNKNMTIA